MAFFAIIEIPFIYIMPTATRTIYIGSDHAGYEMKEMLKKYMVEKTVKFVDLGTFSNDSTDYPDIAREVCEKVIEEKNAFGVLICGTGVGMMMTANRRPGIRAVSCTHELMAKMARLHNDANVLCLGSRLIGSDLAKHIFDVFMDTEFVADERHVRRIEKIEKNAPMVPVKKDVDGSC